jgi:hypothetical protein
VDPLLAIHRDVLGETVLSLLTSLPAVTAVAATRAVVSGVVRSCVLRRKEPTAGRHGRTGVVGER